MPLPETIFSAFFCTAAPWYRTLVAPPSYLSVDVAGFSPSGCLTLTALPLLPERRRLSLVVQVHPPMKKALSWPLSWWSPAAEGRRSKRESAVRGLDRLSKVPCVCYTLCVGFIISVDHANSL